MKPYYQDDLVTLHHGDCLDVLACLPDRSVDAVVTDPPYELAFMGRAWDASGIAFNPAVWAQCLRILKPGGHLLAFGGSRTWHRLAAGIEDAGFEIRDSIAWLYAQGFPKSLNVGLDQRFCQCQMGESRHAEPGAEHAVRDVLGADVSPSGRTCSGSGSVLLTGLPESSAPAARRQELPTAEDRYSESGLEGRRDVQAIAGELRAPADGALPATVRRDVTGEWVCADSPIGDGAVDRSCTDAVGVCESHRSRHLEQHEVEPRALADEPRPQVRRGRAVCRGCGKPQVAGLGTALKPSFEPIVVARKPLAGTVAASVLEYGTGALNIDACRVEAHGRPLRVGDYKQTNSAVWGGRIDDTLKGGSKAAGSTDAGRWPTNVVLDEHQAEVLDRQTGVLHSGTMRAGAERQPRAGGTISGADVRNFVPADTYGDSGGASRFFPVFRYEAKAPTSERPNADGVQHPTVKPLDLMRWLVRLVTPVGAVVLEPFAGSGTTAEACVLEDRQCIAIEREADYLPLIVSRLQKPVQQGLFGLEAGA
ncbi:Modification methylase BamHI [Mycobacteroides abscessus subsp. abscessus]|uniref:DNA methyltransferase n=1 Tax=Mycobacteroides abscessus TaxID=36809 RepID=UPI0009267717|nr:DNA methyltransferase [Mycobacteroides abscessus]SII94024.1 Modification methylase BamHI [Mycobacteroides abscessus subsp. abscessus]SIL07262.1 Modification methylase BamHI [Mycobacteroides abscessus subsp. abscessus]SLK58181.1 Modification methylase BamHI [Mycobacteroides abscessus subsp. abscessus]